MNRVVPLLIDKEFLDKWYSVGNLARALFKRMNALLLQERDDVVEAVLNRIWVLLADSNIFSEEKHRRSSFQVVFSMYTEMRNLYDLYKGSGLPFSIFHVLKSIDNNLPFYLNVKNRELVKLDEETEKKLKQKLDNLDSILSDVSEDLREKIKESILKELNRKENA